MFFVQISDLHIVEPGQKTHGVAPMAENLARCIEYINGMEPAPELVLITGDIADGASRVQTEYAADLLRQLRHPYYIIPGNHDDRGVLWSVFGKGAIPGRADEFLNYVVDLPGMRLIALDSVIAGKSGGQICACRNAWLDARLQEDANTPTVIFLHHPPCNFGVAETDFDGFLGAGEFADTVASYPDIAGVLCGHIHLTAHSPWAGTVVSTAPSMGMQLFPDFALRKPSQFLVEAPAFQLHKLEPDGRLITHTIRLQPVDGPHDF